MTTRHALGPDDGILDVRFKVASQRAPTARAPNAALAENGGAQAAVRTIMMARALSCRRLRCWSVELELTLRQAGETWSWREGADDMDSTAWQRDSPRRALPSAFRQPPHVRVAGVHNSDDAGVRRELPLDVCLLVTRHSVVVGLAVVLPVQVLQDATVEATQVSSVPVRGTVHVSVGAATRVAVGGAVGRPPTLTWFHGVSYDAPL